MMNQIPYLNVRPQAYLKLLYEAYYRYSSTFTAVSVSIAIDGGTNPCPCPGFDEPAAIDTSLVSAIEALGLSGTD